MPKVKINGCEVEVRTGATILEAAAECGFEIPTLCYLKDTQGIGACRVCLVEVSGARDLVASCCMPVEDGMCIETNNQRVRKARKTVVELLLSEHEGDCKTCSRSGTCELQKLANELGIKDTVYEGKKRIVKVDESTPALVRDSAKCVLCRRCIHVCNEIQEVGTLAPQGRGFETLIGPAFCSDLSDVSCVQCGQCAAVCPVGAISEKEHIDEVWAALDDKEKCVIVQTAPAIRAALGECFGMPVGSLVTGKMVTALKMLGFDYVFDTNFTADLTIIEEGTELLKRLREALVEGKESFLPQFTSCSPGWISYVEMFAPDLIPNLSTCKSPQQMMGALVKTYFAKKIGREAKDIFVVSVMPCTAKKFEAKRPEMNASGGADVDAVLTTRELGKMIKQAGINFNSLYDSVMDSPLGLSSGAGDIFANTGGVMEAALRTAYELVTGREIPTPSLHIKEIEGLEGVKKATIRIENVLKEWNFLEGVDLQVAVAHGLGNARKLINNIRSGEGHYHFVEVMTCPGGCIGGGGQPRLVTNEIRESRMKAIFKEDEGKQLRKSHLNPDIQSLYSNYLGTPLGKISHDLLHTHYKERKKA